MNNMAAKSKITARRIYELDLLRGFFIVVIILDHLQFWPSPWQYMTGQGRLWVSAAEGFFIISGVLVGYLRAYRGAVESLRSLSTKLWRRAGLLYIWNVIITLLVVGLTIAIPGDNSLLPKLPDTAQMSSAWSFLSAVFTTAYSSDWIYFLRLYAIMLALTPLFLWLIRRGQWWLAAAISLAAYTISLVFNINEGALQWQLLFFGAAFFGWKLEAITTWLGGRPKLRLALIILLIVTTLTSMALSYFFVHGWNYVESPAASISKNAYLSVRANVDPLFSNNPLEPSRISLAFLWFGGLLALFHVGRRRLAKYGGWLLMPFGTASLTAYCLQAIVFSLLLSFFRPTTSFWLNGIAGAVVVLFLWSLLRIRLVRQILPR